MIYALEIFLNLSFISIILMIATFLALTGPFWITFGLICAPSALLSYWILKKTSVGTFIGDLLFYLFKQAIEQNYISTDYLESYKESLYS